MEEMGERYAKKIFLLNWHSAAQCQTSRARQPPTRALKRAGRRKGREKRDGNKAKKESREGAARDGEKEGNAFRQYAFCNEHG